MLLDRLADQTLCFQQGGMFAEPLQQVGQVDRRLGEVRGTANGIAQQRFGFAQLALPAERQRKVVHRADVVGVDRQASPIGCHRAVGVPERRPGEPEILPVRRDVGPRRQRLRDQFDRRTVIAFRMA